MKYIKFFRLIILLTGITATGQNKNLEFQTLTIYADPLIFTSTQYSKSIVLRNHYFQPKLNNKLAVDNYESFDNYLQKNSSFIMGGDTSLENLNSELKSVKVPSRCLLVFRRNK